MALKVFIQARTHTRTGYRSPGSRHHSQAFDCSSMCWGMLIRVTMSVRWNSDLQALHDHQRKTWKETNTKRLREEKKGICVFWEGLTTEAWYGKSVKCLNSQLCVPSLTLCVSSAMVDCVEVTWRVRFNETWGSVREVDTASLTYEEEE